MKLFIFIMQYIKDRYTNDQVDRGLLFIAYQASITQGFVFLQQNWANNNIKPESSTNSTGTDPIIGQPRCVGCWYFFIFICR
jgi:hypothetical protein